MNTTPCLQHKSQIVSYMSAWLDVRQNVGNELFVTDIVLPLGSSSQCP